MSAAKFTPGPWKFDGEYVWAEAIQGYVANPATEDMLSGDSVPHREKHAAIEANGCLIAAAPELLEACEEALAVFHSENVRLSVENVERIGRLREVIAKVTGEQQ